jgi:hypothetical protein
MQMPFHGLIILALASCQPVANPGDPLQPVTGGTDVVQATPTPLEGPQGDFDFDAEDRPVNELGATIDSESSEEELLALQARANGLDPDELSAPEPAPAPAPEPVAPAPLQAPAAVPAWDPTQPISGGSWGIRLLATLHDVQPPRAVLGLPDGEEIVVQAGTFVEDHRLVVMAVGRDVVQVSRVTPQGFYARVETETLQALYAPDGGN